MENSLKQKQLSHLAAMEAFAEGTAPASEQKGGPKKASKSRRSLPSTNAHLLPAPKSASASVYASTPAPQHDRGTMTIAEAQYEILQYLKRERRAVDKEELARETGTDLSNKDLLAALKANDKIKLESKGYIFRPKYDKVSNKAGVVNEVDKALDGLRSRDLDDTYPKIKEEIMELVRAGRIIVLRNQDTKPPADVLYPAELDCRVHVDPDIQLLWREMHPPKRIDLERLMEKEGLPVMKVEAERPVEIEEGDGKRRRRSNKRTKTHNVHVTGMDFTEDMPPASSDVKK